MSAVSCQPPLSSFSHFIICLIRIYHFDGGEEQHVAFKKVKDVFSSHLIMILLVKCLHLTLYLTSGKKSIGALLVKEV